MSRQRAWQQQALSAQRRDNELRRAQELRKVADYFESNTNKSRHHEQWTTEGYYEKARKEAELFSEKKLKAIQLEERRKKLELMLFQENMQLQQEMKALAAKPKLYKNGSYLNDVPTSTLKEINQGIMDKEEQLRRHEAELRLHHAWRLRQPELRAATAFVAQGRVKSAWTQQIVEKEIARKKEEEENLKILQERDEALRKQIEKEEEKLKEKELQMRELRGSLEGQIAELSEKESVVKRLQKQEERELMILDELKFISRERDREHARLVAERDATIVNMGLHKYKLKKKVLSVLREIDLDLEMMEKLKNAVLKLKLISRSRDREHARLVAERDATIVNMGLHKYKLKKKVVSVLREIDLDLEMMEKLKKAVLKLKLISRSRDREHARLVAERDATIVNMGLHKYKLKKKVLSVLQEIDLDLQMMEKLKKAVLKDIESTEDRRATYKRLLDSALLELSECRERERQRQRNIDAMYDGEARQLSEKQDKLWAKEREARALLMTDVLSTLRRQVKEKVESNRLQQRANVAEREEILGQMESFHQEVKTRERDAQLKNSAYSAISSLQSQLKGLSIQKQQLEAAAEKEAELREASANERKLRKEIARINRDRTEQAWA